MTNEEPVPSTSSVLGSAAVKIVNGSKKRKGLDIDALWRKKFNSVNNAKPSDPEKSVSPAKEPEEELKLISSSSKSTRSLRKKQDNEKKVSNGSKKMEDVEDVKPNIKLLKKTIPAFQCSNIDDGVVQDGMIDPNKISLHNTANYGEESQDEMEVMQNSVVSVEDPNEPRADSYEFGTLEYASAVTPNGAYTLYAADSTTYAPYYQYGNMQSSPQEPGSYLVVSSNQTGAPQSPMSNEDQDMGGLASNQRASPATVNWLLSNYEPAEASSLPRCQLYDHYRKHCNEHRMDAVNAASFGKLIRSVFTNLKTRRLGTRGNSKYHYYGIKIKDTSILNAMPLEQDMNPYGTPMKPQLQRDVYADTVNQVAAVKYADEPMVIPAKRAKQDHSSSSSSCRDSESPSLDMPVQIPTHTEPVVRSLPQPALVPVHPSLTNYQFTDEDKSRMGKIAMPSVPFKNQDTLEATIGFRKLGLSSRELNLLVENYAYMCHDVIRQVKDCKFGDVESIWFKFWSGNFAINQDTLLALCSLERVQEYIIEVDLVLYQTVVDVLIPNVLLSQLSVGMTQACRTFAKNVDIYLRKALQHGKLAEAFIKKKIQAIKYMQQGMKRYTSLNHLALAARGVLQREEQVEQMFQDYSKVDINSVHQQAGWICGCDSMMVQHVNSAFKNNLQRMSSMETWAEWLESIVDQVLAKYHDKPPEVVGNVGKQFLLNWSFYTSTIIRDLTLRSAMSFGSFTLIRLLADDYMYYLIESKIAKAGKQQLITVIRQEKDWPLSQPTQEYIVPANDEDLDLDKNGIL